MNDTTIKITAPLRKYTAGKDQVALQAASAGEALRQLCQLHPGLDGRLLDADGKVRDFIHVYLGKTDIRQLGGLAAPLAAGSVLSIVSPFSGG